MTKLSLAITQTPNGVIIQPKLKSPSNRGINQPKLKSPITNTHDPKSLSRSTKPNTRSTTQQMLKSPIMHDTPKMWVTSLCALCGQQGHARNMCPSFPEHENFINKPVSSMHASQVVSRGTSTSSTPKSKALSTNKACSIFSQFGDYTHHFPNLSRFWDALETICLTHPLVQVSSPQPLDIAPINIFSTSITPTVVSTTETVITITAYAIKPTLQLIPT